MNIPKIETVQDILDKWRTRLQESGAGHIEVTAVELAVLSVAHENLQDDLKEARSWESSWQSSSCW